MKLKLRKKPLSEQIRETSKQKIKPKVKEKVNLDNLIPTSSTLLNCACSDCPTGGYGIGKLVNLIGDSSSGKTLLGLSCFAEMAMFKRFDEYAFIYDDVEAALEFNLDYLFGGEVSDRIDMSVTSDTIQDFYGNITRTIKEGRPFVYILDSLDALTSIEEMKRASAYTKKAPVEYDEDGTKKKAKGSYKMEKAKLVSEILRVSARDIKRTEALIIIISQTRDNIGFGFTDKTRSGGRALKFYSTHEIWLSVLKTLLKRKRAVGVNTGAKVSKNKLTGKVRNVEFPIFYDYGVDDIAANVDFLVAEGIWKKKTAKKNSKALRQGESEGRIIQATHFNIEGTKDKLVRRIENDSIELDLQSLVGEVWNNIEEEIRLKRKPKYS